jgi:hypothetical protein
VLRRLIAADPGETKDLVGLLRTVCRIATRELAASGVGVSVMTADGVRGLSAASDEASEQLEEMQFTFGEGPCFDALADRRPVLISDLSDGTQSRWPVYAPAVRGDGVRAVFAFPLQIGAAQLGAMDVFRRRPGSLSTAEIRTALLFADLTVEALLDRQENLRRREDADGFAPDVGNRAQLFQAQGMVMVQLGISLAEAMMRIRAYAFAEDRRIDDVARDIVDRRLTLDADLP